MLRAALCMSESCSDRYFRASIMATSLFRICAWEDGTTKRHGACNPDRVVHDTRLSTMLVVSGTWGSSAHIGIPGTQGMTHVASGFLRDQISAIERSIHQAIRVKLSCVPLVDSDRPALIYSVRGRPVQGCSAGRVTEPGLPAAAGRTGAGQQSTGQTS